MKRCKYCNKLLLFDKPEEILEICYPYKKNKHIYKYNTQDICGTCSMNIYLKFVEHEKPENRREIQKFMLKYPRRMRKVMSKDEYIGDIV